MLRFERFKTGHEKTILTRSLLPKCALEVQYEFLLRFILKDPSIKEIKLEEAIVLCEQFLFHHPENNFLHLARAYLYAEKEAPEKAKNTYRQTRASLMKAIELQGPVEHIEKTAAHNLTNLHFELNEFVSGYAWLAAAIVLDVKPLATDFLAAYKTLCAVTDPVPDSFGLRYLASHHNVVENRKDLKKLIGLLAFIVMALNKKDALPNPTQSAWFKVYKEPTQALIMGVNYRTPNEILRELLQAGSASCQLVMKCIHNNFAVCLDFFAYCARHKILTGEYYLQLMAAIHREIVASTYKNKVFVLQMIDRNLFLFYARGNMLDAALFYLQRANLDNLSLADLQDVTVDKHILFYSIFKCMVRNKQLDEALVYLNAVTDAALYDETIFDLFHLLDKQELSLGLLESKKIILERTLAKVAEGHIYAAPFLERVKAELAVVSSPVMQLRAHMYSIPQRYLTYLDIRKQRMASAYTSAPYAFGVNARAALKESAIKLTSDTFFLGEIITAIQANLLNELRQKVVAFAKECQQQISGDKTAEMLKDMEVSINEINKIMRTSDCATLVEELQSALVRRMGIAPQALDQQPQYYLVPVEQAPPSTYHEACMQTPAAASPPYATPMFAPAFPFQSMGVYNSVIPLFAPPAAAPSEQQRGYDRDNRP